MTPNRRLETFRALADADPHRAAALYKEVRRRMLVPHDGGQKLVIASPARFKVLRAGRRWGKTKVGAHLTVKNALAEENATIWWVANRWRNTRRGYKEVLKQLPPQLLKRPAPAETASELTLQLINGTNIEFYSGESPDSLAGAGVKFVVVDEAALMRENVWQQLIRPTLMDTGGHALIISTPRGRNYFYDLWNRGHDPDVADIDSFWFPQEKNPYIPASETQAAREELPDLIFRQEIMAEFVSDAASIFNVPEGVFVPGLAPPEGEVYMGVDLARKADWTVITAARRDGLPVYHDRFTGLRWADQKDAILNARETLLEGGAEHVIVGVDATGVGDAMVEELELEDIDLVPINFTNRWKLRAVKDLGAGLEQGQAFLLEEQRAEFETYEYEISEAGNYKFEAAVGHDDEVSAKLIEHYLRTQEAPGDVHEVTWAGLSDDEGDEWNLDEPAPDVRWLDLRPDSPEEIMQRPEVWTATGELTWYD